ncbi:DUF4225 domain-containing protein [Enterobacteriaceae bacterium LUAb1]
MDNYFNTKRLSGYYLTMSKLEADRLLKEADIIASRNLKSMIARRDFLSEIRDFINYNIKFIHTATSDKQRIEGINNLKREYQYIQEQDRSMSGRESKLYASIKLVQKNGLWEYVLIGVGILGALGQIVAGTGILLSGSATVVGGLFGATLIAHGINGLLENYHFVTEDKSYTGPVRGFYEKAATLIGQDKKYGSIIYGGIDLILSGAGLIRNILRPDAKRLFHYLNSDYIKTYKNMSKKGLTLEIFNDSVTINSMKESYQK